MVVIECPHCDEDLEMEDGAHGLFECPYCQNEYQWGETPKSKKKKSTSSINLSKLKKKSRTKSLDSKTKRFEGKKQTKSHKQIDILGYGGIQVCSLFATFAMLMLIITGLNSDNWYTADWWEEYDSDERENRDLSQGTGSGTTMSFGTSQIITEYVRDTRVYNGVDSVTDGEEYEEIRYSGMDYNNMLVSISAAISMKEEYCKDSDNGWGMTEDEFNKECRESLGQLNDQNDWYSSWDNAGTIIIILMIISFILCLLVFSIKTVLLLHQLGFISHEKNMLTKIAFFDNILSSILGGILIIGLIFYWLAVPDFNLHFEFQGGYEPDDYSYGLGMIWWLTMIFSFIYVAISVAGMRNEGLTA